MKNTLPVLATASITTVSIILLRYLHQRRESKHRLDTHDHVIPLNFNLDNIPFVITESMLDFLRVYTKQDDYEYLRNHVIDFVQALKASNLHIYRCIQSLAFLTPKIQMLRYYSEIIQSNGKIIDIGCGLGQEVRKLITDGVSPEDITVVDLHDGYWDYGKILFMDSNAMQNQVRTVFGDLSKNSSDGGINLLDLIDQYQYALALAVLHCLSQDEVSVFLHNTFNILKSGSNAKLIGWTVGNSDDIVTTSYSAVKTPKGDAVRYLHSASSLRDLLQQIGFVHVEIEEDELGESLQQAQLQGNSLNQNNIISFGTRKLYFVAEKQ